MGRYELLFRIASGGMAEVYAARVLGEAGFQKLVAVKRMLPTLADDEEFVTMFLDEARVAANISSPHCVQTLDLGRDAEGALYIVMELVVGVTLGRIMKEATKVRRVIPLGIAIELVAQAAQGLDAAHEATTPIGEPLHIVHRDVSPQNVLVGVDGRARLTDFGVARAVLRATKTDAGRIKGKFAYCAPEQLRSEQIDRRADIFALGVVAWEMIAGQRLFVAEHPLATMERVTNMPILPPHQVRSNVPEAVSDVVLAALARPVDERPATAAQFANDLRDAARRGGVELPSPGEIGRFVRAAGGQVLEKMRANIQVTLASDDAEVLDDSAPFQLIEETSHVSATDMHGGKQAEESVSDFDASGVSRTPGSLMVEAPRKKRLPAPLLFAAFLLVGAGVGIGSALLVSDEPAPEPVASPLDPREGAETEAATTAMAAEPTMAQTPVAPPEEPMMAAEPETTQADPEEADTGAMRTTRTPRMTRTMARTTREPDPPRMEPERIQRVESPMETPMDTPMTTAMTEMASPMTSSMGSSTRMTLVGLDAFDRELGN